MITTDLAKPVGDDPWELNRNRRAIIEQYGSEEQRQHFNNHDFMRLDLWSEHQNVDRLVMNLCRMMWGKTHRKRVNHLKVILLNLLRVHTSDPCRYLAYRRSPNHYAGLLARYNPAGISALISKVMDSLVQEELITNHRGRYTVKAKMGYVSKARAKSKLTDLMKLYAVDTTMITKHPNVELIQLKEPSSRKWGGDQTVKISGKQIDYSDTDDILMMRDRLETYNKYMSEVIIEYRDSVVPVGPVCRIFNGDFTSGGRFYGGFWQGINEEKRSEIRINYEPVVELDYCSQHLNLLYAQVGIQPEDDDLYDVADAPRKIAKRAMLMMIGGKRRHNVIDSLEEYRQEKYPDLVIDAKKVVEDLEVKHWPIMDLLYQGSALELQYVDSQIADQVITTLTNDDIPCLIIHDSFIVSQQYESRLKKVMEEAFKDVAHVDYNPSID